MKPVGQLLGTFEELHAVGCIQTGADVGDLGQVRAKFEPLFHALQLMTGHNVCDGCPAFNNGACRAFLKFHTSRAAALSKPMRIQQKLTKSIRQWARELGVSINEVQRRRDRGELETAGQESDKHS